MLHPFYSEEEGYTFAWIELNDCPIYIRPKTAERARLRTSLTSSIRSITQHGKIELIFEDLLHPEGGKKLYNKWDPSEWFEFRPPAK
jgi:hypothetical protein